jgi:hypothetical protein
MARWTLLTSKRCSNPITSEKISQQNALVAKSTIRFVRQTINLVDDSPAKSLNLSVMENGCGIMKNTVDARSPKSIDEWKTCLREERDALDQAALDGLIRSVPKRRRLRIKHAEECISLSVQHRPPSRDVASPSERVPAVSTIRAERIDRVVPLPGVITRMHNTAIDDEKRFRLQDQWTFP